VPTNEGTTALHGGFNGFDRMPWHVTQRTDTRVRLTLTSPDGDNGFPGTVEVSVTYTVSPGQVRIDYTATTDRVTPFNVTNHAYFNLDGEGSGAVDDHELELTASAMLPIDAANLPTGEIRPVEGTAVRPARAAARRRRPRGG
jgi:aldose 1-epimerase